MIETTRKSKSILFKQGSNGKKRKMRCLKKTLKSSKKLKQKKFLKYNPNFLQISLTKMF